MSGMEDVWPDRSGSGRDQGDALLGFEGVGSALGETAPRPGSPLPRFRPSLSLQRTRFTVELADGSTTTVDVNHTSQRASMYRNDHHVKTAEMPAQFAVGHDRVEVAATRYGMQRIHLVHADGTQRRLDAAPGTPEHWRDQLSRRHPGVGRALAVGAVIVLAANLALLAPQLLETVSHSAIWARYAAPLNSPVALPVWANTALAFTAALAGVERALTFRHNRLLDVDTDFVDT
ncbi:hypothetical protein [Streptomyces spiramenti]|uniref:Uncharacterized protein n=1 Tax=Streptomyces spiramenti TaxID=2720606 RepID=A0ABX1AQE8_9ACTN|nr:hypothetical protein [Streptomyces spiramenti]NJP66918.1 hypothetical protein [Streptomyces spiramenti]